MRKRDAMNFLPVLSSIVFFLLDYLFAISLSSPIFTNKQQVRHRKGKPQLKQSIQ
jgi:hypothetical protein